MGWAAGRTVAGVAVGVGGGGGDGAKVGSGCAPGLTVSDVGDGAKVDSGCAAGLTVPDGDLLLRAIKMHASKKHAIRSNRTILPTPPGPSAAGEPESGRR